MKQLLYFVVMLIIWVIFIVLSLTETATPLLVLFLFHFLEYLIVGIKVGKSLRKSVWCTFVMTMMFGSFWWKPLYDRIKEDDISEEILVGEEM